MGEVGSLKINTNIVGVGHLKKVRENPSLRKEWKEKKKQNISCNVSEDLLICLFHSFGLVYICFFEFVFKTGTELCFKDQR